MIRLHFKLTFYNFYLSYLPPPWKLARCPEEQPLKEIVVVCRAIITLMTLLTSHCCRTSCPIWRTSSPAEGMVCHRTTHNPTPTLTLKSLPKFSIKSLLCPNLTINSN